MKRRLPEIVLVLVIAAFAGWTVGCGSELPDNAVAKVGDSYITVEQFDTAVTQEATTYGITKETYPDIYAELQKWVVGNLVANELAVQEATKLGLSVTDAEVQTEVDSYLDAYYAGDQAAMDKELEAAGMTLEAFKKTIKDGLLRDKVKAEVVKDISSVSEEEIVAYYDANKTTYYVEPSRGLRHILIKPAPTGPNATITDADWAQALSTARDVRRRLAAGGDWTELAAEYSADPGSKDKGGDLGTVVPGQTVKEFEDAGFGLELNEISQPVKSVYGYHIIQATAVTKGGQQTLEEVRARIEPTLLTQAQDEVWNKWLEQKTADADVIYRDDLRPAPTTTTQSTTTTTLAGPTTTAVPSAATTTTT